MTEERHFFRPDEFAERFQISKRQVYRMIQSGKISVIFIGKCVRIPREEYCRFCDGTSGCIPCNRH